jgi:hypothetical protein
VVEFLAGASVLAFGVMMGAAITRSQIKDILNQEVKDDS